MKWIVTGFLILSAGMLVLSFISYTESNQPTASYTGNIESITIVNGGFLGSDQWIIEMNNTTITGLKGRDLSTLFVFHPDIIYTITVSDVYILSIEEMKQ